ncbi:hypothetical protein N0V95_000519 [Ascochyta clinopodiicola]|nr:hypothetical protein N0V95_000519 [Ascochyta clinopodiicola]
MKAKALGIWGAAGSLGFIIGLVLGGVLTAFLGWRWIFWISLIISGIVIPAAYAILPRVYSPRAATAPPVDGVVVSDSEPPSSRKRLLKSVRERLVRFDALGISLGIPGILLLTYSLTSANTEGWNDPKIIATLVISTLLVVAFILYERSEPQAILAPHLFRDLSFGLTMILAVNTYAVRQACTYFLTVQLQSYGTSAIHTSVLFIPLGISALIFNTLSGRLVPILGAKAMVRHHLSFDVDVLRYRISVLTVFFLFNSSLLAGLFPFLVCSSSASSPSILRTGATPSQG